MIAETLSHYRILDRLGAGGMGVVYKARDTRLDRTVALKILRPDLVADPARTTRFTAEAKAASALNHPNIITIYDIGSHNGTNFIVMEYVSGRTLGELIERKALPVNECVGYAMQVVEALTAAHRAGIIHRDLKPGNIMVAANGRLKLLDFGLAKLIVPPSTPEGDENASTRTAAKLQSPLTKEGQIVGTVAYMSPEQITGTTVDTKTDIFSFGIVLYEMLTGRRPFGGSTTFETAAEILKNEPKSPRELAPGVPLALERIIGHCLRKEPDQRFQSIADVGRLLDDIRSDLKTGQTVDASAPSSWARSNGRKVLLAGVAVLTLSCAAGAAAWMMRYEAAEPLAQLTRLTFDSGLTTDPAVSHDGKLLAFASDRDGRGNLDIWVRQLAGGEPVQVTRDAADEFEPDFSPDSTKIAYRSNREGGGIYIVSALGASEPQLIAVGGHSPRFSPNGRWISYHVGEMSGLTSRPMRSKLFVMDLNEGQSRQIESSLVAASSAIWSPDSKHILFSGSEVGNINAPTDWYVAALDSGKATRMSVADVFGRRGLSEVIPHAWVEGDEVIFSAKFGDSRNIWRLPISQRTWKVKAAPKRMTSGTGMESHAALAAVLSSERLVFSVLNFRTNLWTVPLDASGARATGPATRITDDEATAGFPDLTADGNVLVFASNRSGTKQIWSRYLRTRKEMAITAGPADVTPTIAPDGSVLAYQDEDKWAKFAVPLGGTNSQPRSRSRIAEGDGWPYSWSSDGMWLFYAVRAERWGIEAVHRTSGRKYTVFQHPGYDVTYFHPSPDNRWALASAFETPAAYIQIAPIREGIAVQPDEWVRIVSDAAEHDRPVWSSDGTLVYYTSFRDGFRCIWAQRLDNDTKRPSIAPAPVYHSHSAGLSLRNAGQTHFRIAVAADKLVFNMGELRGNLWMATFQKEPPPH